MTWNTNIEKLAKESGGNLDTAVTHLAAIVSDIAAMSDTPTEKAPTWFVKAGTTTAAALIGSETFVRKAVIIAKRTGAANDGIVHISPSSDLNEGTGYECYELSPGASVTIEAPFGTKFDLNDFFIENESGTDNGVVGYYIPA